MSVWQPIETAPKDGTRVLLFFPTLKRDRVRAGSFVETVHSRNGQETYRRAAWWADADWPLLSEIVPSHWAPLPNGPSLGVDPPAEA